MMGFGIFCFGEKYYYEGAYDKAKHIIDAGYKCYILTEDTNYFKKLNCNIIPYYRAYKSYHDKILLTKYILKECDICILLDADLEIRDYSFLEDLRNYNFKEGVSYVDVLLNHPEKKEFVKELNLYSREWLDYTEYCESIYPQFENIKLMWEYFLVINKKGFNDNFYIFYDKLQVKKESCHVFDCKDVVAPGEGVSITISAILSNIKIDRDLELYSIVKNKIKSVSNRFLRKV
jgi:hypothetical protein